VEDRKNENSCGYMERNIHKMVHARFNAEDLAIEHVGEPGERMPVEQVHAGERPGNRMGSQTRLYERILCEVQVVVEIDKIEPARRSVQEGNQEGQADHDKKNNSVPFTCAWNGSRRDRLLLRDFLPFWHCLQQANYPHSATATTKRNRTSVKSKKRGTAVACQ